MAGLLLVGLGMEWGRARRDAWKCGAKQWLSTRRRGRGAYLLFLRTSPGSHLRLPEMR